VKTSSFEQSGDDLDAVSIALTLPDGFTGKVYERLIPPGQLVWPYKANLISSKTYTEQYLKRLSRLSPSRTALELERLVRGEPILLCHCDLHKRPFCHRRVVAKWLEDALGIVIPELNPPRPLPKPRSPEVHKLEDFV
jgi:hypothetical protein